MPKANRVVVVGSDNVSAQQMQDFFRKAADGTFDSEDLQVFLDNPKRFSKHIVTLTRAIKIMSARKVITAAASAQAWNKPVFNMPICYSEATLKQAAAENQLEQADWRLVFCQGNSLRYQRQIRSTDTAPEKQPCFYSGNTWWLGDKEDGWALRQNAPGYYLINFIGFWRGLTWDDQEAELQKLGPQYERTDPAIFSEAILTNFMVNKERIAENWYHWSGVTVSDGSFVNVGNLDACGLYVLRSHRGYSGSFLRVCLCRKFDA